MSDLVKRLTGISATIGLPWDAAHRRIVFDTIREAAARIEALEAALRLASNRLARVGLEFNQSNPLCFEIDEWRKEAEASLLEPKT